MIGARLGKWVIDRELGRGGMGSVYHATDASNGDSGAPGPHEAAVKLLTPALAQESGFRQRFEREIEALGRLKHPHIVQFYEAGEHQGACYYVMEYVSGPSLDDVLDEVSRLPWEQVLHLSVQVCAALKHAHDHGVIHRDIKPTNLLLDKDGDVKLVDFGVAKVFANSPLTATNAVVGTADYLSPEQASGKPVTRRSDLYALGIVMYRALTGRTPFQADTVLEMMHKHKFAQFDSPRKFAPDMPHDLDAVVCRLLEKDPDKRPPDAYVLARELEGIRRKLIRQHDATTDMTKRGATVADTQPDGGTAEANPGPATLMSQLVRKELEDLNREGPIGRLLNRAWLLILLLVVIIGVLVYGLWPKSPEALLDEAETLVQKGNWREANARLDRLEQKHEGHGYGEQVGELRQQISDGLAIVAARRTPETSQATLKPSASEAERFYREGVQDYQTGRIETARLKWQQLIDAFSGVESQRAWVALAKEALKASETPASDFAAVEEALRLARAEKPEQAARRLRALAALYEDRQDMIGRAVRSRIAEALRELDGVGGK